MFEITLTTMQALIPSMKAFQLSYSFIKSKYWRKAVFARIIIFLSLIGPYVLLKHGGNESDKSLGNYK